MGFIFSEYLLLFFILIVVLVSLVLVLLDFLLCLGCVTSLSVVGAAADLFIILDILQKTTMKAKHRRESELFHQMDNHPHYHISEMFAI
jgi:hypothetical protein